MTAVRNCACICLESSQLKLQMRETEFSVSVKIAKDSLFDSTPLRPSPKSPGSTHTYEMAPESSTPILQAPTDASEDAEQCTRTPAAAEAPRHGCTLHNLHTLRTHTGGSRRPPLPPLLLHTHENTLAASLPNYFMMCETK